MLADDVGEAAEELFFSLGASWCGHIENPFRVSVECCLASIYRLKVGCVESGFRIIARHRLVDILEVRRLEGAPDSEHGECKHSRESSFLPEKS